MTAEIATAALSGAGGLGLGSLVTYDLFRRGSLPRRKYDSRKVWKKLESDLNDLNEELRAKIGMPKGHGRLLWRDLNFVASIDAYAEATSCHHFGLLESTAVMCRTALDSAIYLGITQIRQEDPTTSHFRESSSKNIESSLWRWRNLRKFALEFKLLDNQSMKLAELIREAGNYSAHLASSQDREEKKHHEEYGPVINQWMKDLEAKRPDGNTTSIDELLKILSETPPPSTPGYKTRTWPSEAWYVLNSTEIVLATVIRNYFLRPETMSARPLS